MIWNLSQQFSSLHLQNDIKLFFENVKTCKAYVAIPKLLQHIINNVYKLKTCWPILNEIYNLCKANDFKPITISQQYLSECTSQSISSVKRQLKKLEQFFFVIIGRKKIGPKKNALNTYQFNIPPQIQEQILNSNDRNPPTIEMTPDYSVDSFVEESSNYDQSEEITQVKSDLLYSNIYNNIINNKEDCSQNEQAQGSVQSVPLLTVDQSYPKVPKPTQSLIDRLKSKFKKLTTKGETAMNYPTRDYDEYAKTDSSVLTFVPGNEQQRIEQELMIYFNNNCDENRKPTLTDRDMLKKIAELEEKLENVSALAKTSQEEWILNSVDYKLHRAFTDADARKENLLLQIDSLKQQLSTYQPKKTSLSKSNTESIKNLVRTLSTLSRVDKNNIQNIAKQLLWSFYNKKLRCSEEPQSLDSALRIGLHCIRKGTWNKPRGYCE